LVCEQSEPLLQIVHLDPDRMPDHSEPQNFGQFDEAADEIIAEHAAGLCASSSSYSK
jgi:hypothetical protein